MAMTDKQYIEAARRQYAHEGEIEIDEDAPVSRGADPGAYVQAWVWVEDPERRKAEDGGGSEEDYCDVCGKVAHVAPALEGRSYDMVCADCAAKGH